MIRLLLIPKVSSGCEIRSLGDGGREASRRSGRHPDNLAKSCRYSQVQQGLHVVPSCQRISAYDLRGYRGASTVQVLNLKVSCIRQVNHHQ